MSFLLYLHDTVQRDSYLHAPFLCYFAVLTLWMLLLWHWMRNSSSPTLKRFAWGVAGGSVTGLQNFLKDSLTILKAVNDPDSNAHGLPWYLFLLGLLAVVAAFGGLLLLTACMKRYDATYSAAMFVGSFVLSASLMSVVHYSTFQHLESLWNTILYPTGLLVLMGGVYVLVKAVKDVPQHDDDDDDGLNNGVDRSESSASQQRRILDNSDMVRFLRSRSSRRSSLSSSSQTPSNHCSVAQIIVRSTNHSYPIKTAFCDAMALRIRWSECWQILGGGSSSTFGGFGPCFAEAGASTFLDTLWLASVNL